MPPQVDFHPLAADEAVAAKEWYFEIRPSLAEEFDTELERAIERIAASPGRWASYLHGTRVFLLHRFPYLVVYRFVEDQLQVIAVQHAHPSTGLLDGPDEVIHFPTRRCRMLRLWKSTRTRMWLLEVAEFVRILASRDTPSCSGTHQTSVGTLVSSATQLAYEHRDQVTCQDHFVENAWRRKAIAMAPSYWLTLNLGAPAKSSS